MEFNVVRVVAALLCLVVAASSQAPRPRAEVAPQSLLNTVSPADAKKAEAEFGAGFGLSLTDRFKVVGNTGKRYREVVAASAEQLLRELEPGLFKKKPAKPLTLVLFDQRYEFVQYLTQRGVLPHAAYDALPAVSADGDTVYACRNRSHDADRDFDRLTPVDISFILAALVDARARAEFPDAPAFLVMGLAASFRGAHLVKGRLRHGGPYYEGIEHLFHMLETRPIPALAALLAIDRSVFEPERARYEMLAYGFNQYLQSLGDAPYQKILDGFRTKKSGIEILKAGGVTMDNLEQKWRSFAADVLYSGPLTLDRAGYVAKERHLESARSTTYFSFAVIFGALGMNEDKRHEEALAFADQAISDPRTTRPHMAILERARALQGLGRTPEAITAYEEFLSHQPWMAEINDIGWNCYLEILEKTASPKLAEKKAELERLRALDAAP